MYRTRLYLPKYGYNSDNVILSRTTVPKAHHLPKSPTTRLYRPLHARATILFDARAT